MLNIKCKDCMYWDPNRKQCRRHAPRLIIDNIGEGCANDYMPDWTYTTANDWCGDYEATAP